MDGVAPPSHMVDLSLPVQHLYYYLGCDAVSPFDSPISHLLCRSLNSVGERRQLEFKSYLRLLPAVWTWACDLSSLSLRSLTDKMEVDDVSCIRSLGGLSEIFNEVKGDGMSCIVHSVALSS